MCLLQQQSPEDQQITQKKSPKGKEQQDRQDFKLAKVRARWGLFCLLLLRSVHSGASSFSGPGP